MIKRKTTAMLAAAATLGIVLAACSSGSSTSSGVAPSNAARLTSCPSSSLAAPGGVPSGGTGAPGEGGGAPNIPIAKTIAPTDTSTSIVIDGSGPEIPGGKTQLTTYGDILYDTPTSAGNQVPLKLDLQVPKTSGKK